MARDYMLRVRLSAEDVATLDKRRGKLSRSAFMRSMLQGLEGEQENNKPELIGERKPIVPDVRGEAREPLWKDAKSKRLV